MNGWQSDPERELRMLKIALLCIYVAAALIAAGIIGELLGLL